MLVTVGDSDLFCCVLVIVQFSPLADWVVGGPEGQYSRDHLPVVVVVVVVVVVLQEAFVSSSGMGRDVNSMMLSIKYFLCRSRRRPPSKVP